MTDQRRAALEAKAKEIRALTIDAIGYLGVGHVGGSLSIVELLAVLYHERMRVDPERPRWRERDRLVLSKGHAGPALYAALATKGFIPLEELHTLNRGGTLLPSHCDRNRTRGIDMTTGSLGQGLSAACGIALANRADGIDCRVYAILGDGECDEGQVWEAAMLAKQYRLTRLTAFIDCNKLQIDGATSEVMDLESLTDKWSAFGWVCLRADGHDVGAIDGAIEEAIRRSEAEDRPAMIVLDTVKGKGARFCEGLASNHNMNLDYETAKRAIAEL
jgi:Transketolase, N-terminal subunit